MIRSECFPSKYPHTEWAYYSPGVCPSGWVLNSATSIQQRFAPYTSSGETIGICCPSRYTYVDGPVGCTSYLAQSTSGSVLIPSYFVKFVDEMPYTAQVPQTVTVSDATVTIVANVPSTLTTGAVYSSSQIPPVSSEETIVSVSTINPTTYTTTWFTTLQTFACEISGPCFISTLINVAGSEVIDQPLSILTSTIESEIIYSEITAIPIYSTSSIPPGVVWASGIQIRWTGNYPINQSRGLTPGQKAGVSLGVIISLAIIAVIVLWRIRILRFKKRRLQATHDPVLEAAVEEPKSESFQKMLERPSAHNHMLLA
jgi:hypothetical protein